MAARGWLIAADREGWRLWALPVAEAAADDAPAEAATAGAGTLVPWTEPSGSSPAAAAEDLRGLAGLLRQALVERGYRGEPVLLALASEACLSAAFPLPATGKRSDPQTLIYCFEEFVPMAAEDLSADFLLSGAEALGVAVANARLSPLLEALEEHGVVVQSVSPRAVLALESLVLDGKTSASLKSASALVAWGHGDQVDLLILVEGALRCWHLTDLSSAQLLRWTSVESLSHGGPSPLVACHLPAPILEALRASPDVEVLQAEDVAQVLAAARAADEILTGKRPAWIELRRGRLASGDPLRPIRSSLRFAGVQLTLCLLAIAGGLLAQSYRYEQLAVEQSLEQESIYRRTLSGSPPAGVRARLESELARLSGLSGESKDLPERIPGLLVIRDTLEAMPAELRFRLLEVRFNRERFSMEGEVPAHTDADTIANALRGRGLSIEPPRTQQLADRRISFRIAGAWSTPEAAAPVRPRPPATPPDSKGSDGKGPDAKAPDSKRKESL